jgi:DNA-binding NarL/FixJ family response regulator
MGIVRPTVLIVDDHEVFRASARALLQAGGFDVIGEAAGGMEAIEAVSMLHPEVVNHAVAAERRRCDDEPANRARMPNGQLHPDLTAVAEPEHIDRPDGEFFQQCGHAVCGTLK